MDVVSGNYFHDLNVTTTFVSSPTASAYIEGGGIIGVNGVSSPDASIGHARLKGLENNAFTDIAIRSNDVLLGGGIVGVNNNSKDLSGDISGSDTYARIDSVKGNIFGNGNDKSITVDIGYSLRGGGVIGLNGLGSAAIDLPDLTSNVFAGIDVTAGSYIKGGGIIGLQNNDDDYKKDNISPIDFVATDVRAGDISDNVFVNLNVSAGEKNTSSLQYIQGGGIIGIRSNMGVAHLEKLENNIFKDIQVIAYNAADNNNEGLFGGGVVGLYSVAGYSEIGTAIGNYFDGIDVSVKGTITGGGVIGAANEKNTSPVTIQYVQSNTFLNTIVKTTNGNIIGGGILGVSSEEGIVTFNNISDNKFFGKTDTTIEIDVAGKIEGGGVIGARTNGTDLSSGSVMVKVSGNNIQDYDVKTAGAIEGGGLIGTFSKNFGKINNLADNILSNNTVTAQNIDGGGVVGVRALDGSAEIETANLNKFNNSTILSNSDLKGGGIIGVYSENSGYAKISTINENEFNTTNVTSTTGNLEGGGIIGVRANSGNAEIGTANINKFNNSTISSNGDLQGGGIIGVCSESNGYAKISTINDNLFDTTKVTSGKLEGGGIIGVQSNSGNAEIETATSNNFNKSTISSNGDLQGGGIISVRSESGLAKIGTFDSNTFNATEVTSGNKLEGAGMISVRANKNAEITSANSNQFNNSTILSKNGKAIEGGGIIAVRSESGLAKIGTFNDNTFEVTNVTSDSNLTGGGIIGVYATNGNAFIETANNNTFDSAEISSSNSGAIEGGGVIGLRVDGAGTALIDSIDNTVFNKIKVTSDSYLEGGGIIGIRAGSGDAAIGSITKSTFSENVVTTKGYLQGGGIVSVQSEGIAYIGTIDTTLFTNNKVTSNDYLEGGGIIGVHTNKGDAEIETATNNTFTDSTISSNGVLQGGGLIGVHSEVSGLAKISTISDNQFNTTKVTSVGKLEGGGIIGVRSNSGNAEIGTANINIFNNSTISSNGDLQGGGIIGVRSETGLAKIGTFDKNEFINTTKVTSVGKLEGGGIVGVRAGNGNAEIETATNNTFTGSIISSTNDLQGGGIIGVRSENSGSAKITTINDNKFVTTKVTSGGKLEGGGIIGVRANSGNAEIGTISENDFTGVIVTTDADLTGGGVVGVRANAGNAVIDNLINNRFHKGEITVTGALKGGGIVGVQSKTGNASINKIEELETFSGNKINAASIDGGGIVGVDGVSASITSLAGHFENNTVTSKTDAITGGGIIGVNASSGNATIGNIESTGTFEDNTVTAKTNLVGGGIIGVASNTGRAVIESSGVTFTKNTVKTEEGEIQGGGIIGVNAASSGVATIGNIKSTSTFEGNIVTAKTNLVGGGIIGVASETGSAVIESIQSSRTGFSNNVVTTETGYLQGGGIIGVRSDSFAYIGTIGGTSFSSPAFFTENNVTSAKWIDGGGIIGVSGIAKGTTFDPHGGIGLIANSVFANNTVKAEDGQVMGGIIYSYGAAGGMVISDSQFDSNVFDSKVTTTIYGTDYDAKVYGAVTIDTGATAYDGDTEHVVTINATNGNDTLFYNNAIYEGTVYNNDPSAPNTPNRYNSLYFGTMPYIDDSNTVQQDYAAANAKLIIAPDTGGYVYLIDPLKVYQDNGNGGEFTFNMEVEGHGEGNGMLVWGGANEFQLAEQGQIDDDLFGTITMKTGSNTTILDATSETTLFFYGKLWGGTDAFPVSQTMTLDAPQYTVNLNTRATLSVEGHNYWNLSTANPSDHSLAKANFNGTLFFNLNNTDFYNDTVTPAEYAKTGNGIPLLTIDTPDQAGMIDLTGATVKLQNFLGDTPLVEGDRFYLIAVEDETDGQNNFKGADALSNNKDEDGRFVARARQGLTREYTFIIDLNGEHQTENLVNSHYLTARLRGDRAVPAKELVPPGEGRVTGFSFINHLASPTLYNIDPKCDPCEPCDSVGQGGQWVRTPFASIGGDWYRNETGNDSYFDVRGSVFQAGVAYQKKVDKGRVFWGVFFDSGYADYNTYNYLDIDNIKNTNDFRGDGELTVLGGGVLLRKIWNNGWQVDGIVRGGNLQNKYANADIEITNTNFAMKYDIDSAYVNMDWGATYQKKLSKRIWLDFYGRYAYTFMEANTIGWDYYEVDAAGNPIGTPYSESVRFSDIQSHRLKLGMRYTKKRNSHLSYYLGAAYEYEFDGTSYGEVVDEHGTGRFGVPSLDGGYGIGEIGVTFRPGDNFLFNTALQGYSGNRTGGNINLSAVWKW
jgi:hypothetical protein